MKQLSPKHKTQLNRPREKMLLRGASNLTNSELIQIILGSGNRHKNVAELASELEDIVFRPGSGIKLVDLLGVSGISLAKGTKLLAAIEIAHRLRSRKERQLNEPEKVIPFLHSIAHKNKEHLVLLTLNGAKQILNQHQISVGTLNSTLVHPRELFIEAIKDRAAGIILAHNHPGLGPEPSPEDDHITRIVAKAGKILGIELVDHLIVDTNLDFYSFRDAGKL